MQTWDWLNKAKLKVNKALGGKKAAILELKNLKATKNKMPKVVRSAAGSNVYQQQTQLDENNNEMFIFKI